MRKSEVSLDPGTSIQLTSLRTRRKVLCTTTKLLGLGGMAKVYGGELEDGTQVVLKTQRFEGRGADHSLEVEIELFKKLFHRNIVHCVGVGLTPAGLLTIGFRRAYQNPLLLMAKASVDEGMRRDKRARYPCLPLDTTIDLTFEMLNALTYLERLGFVHHDVKLANLLIDVASKERPLEGSEVFGRVVRRNYRAVLIDFGATRSRNYLEAWNRGEAVEGIAPQITPFYAPPEAVVETRREDGELGLTFHPSIDVYAAALLLYALLTGHPPYSHLRTAVDHNDMESVIAAKSAERRGEISPVSDEIIGRVVFEDTKFISGERAAFDVALSKFLVKRLDPDPEARGTAAEMKREFEKLCQIRSRRGHEERGVGGSRVFLPFQQELIDVGAGKEHPLMRAARLYGLEGRREASGRQPRSESDRVRRSLSDSSSVVSPGSDSGKIRGLSDSGVARRKAGESSGRLQRAAEPSARTEESLDWLQEMDATAAKAGAASPPPSTPPARKRPPPRKPRRKQRAPSGRVPAQRNPGQRTPTPPPRSPTPPPRSPTPAPAKPPAQPPGGRRTMRMKDATTWGNETAFQAESDELLRRAGRRRRRRREPPGSTRAGVPAPGPSRNPVGRGYPPDAATKANHCLLSPVLDQPLLLDRKRVYHIGRDPSVDVRIKSDLVSRRHAEVAWDGRGFVLKDLGSLNGTTLNGFKLTAITPLHDEDRIGFGGFEFVVRVLSGKEWTVNDEGGSTKILKGKEDWGRIHTPTFAGDLTRLALRDVVEIIDWKQHSGTLEIADQGKTRGTIWFVEGKMVHAEGASMGKGMDAAVGLFRSLRGSFVFKHGRINQPRTIDASLEEVWRVVRERSG